MRLQRNTVADLNIERLVGASYVPEMPDAAFVQNVEEKLLFTACQLAENRKECLRMPSRQPVALDKIRRQSRSAAGPRTDRSDPLAPAQRRAR